MDRSWLGVEKAIEGALAEDLGLGDVTTDAIVPPGTRGRAVLLAKEDLVLAGLPVFKAVFGRLSTEIRFEDRYAEGDRVPAGATVTRLYGGLGDILRAERTALNFIQRMSGIATLARRYVEKVAAYGCRIVDTRKTVPGLRRLDKYAVRVGGALNHRFGLFDGILIKDNHIAAAGSITLAVQRARAYAPHTLKVEVEVENEAQAREALAAGVEAVLLDNMDAETLQRTVTLLRGKVLMEASGGITLETVEAVARAGVDLISVGALTHSPRAADLSLEVMPLEAGE